MRTALFAIHTDMAATAYGTIMLGYVRPDYADMLDTLFAGIALFEGHVEPNLGRLRC